MNVNVFDAASVDRALEEIKTITTTLKKLDEVVRRIAEVGAEVAKDRYSGYNISVKVVKVGNNAYQIQAEGADVAYVEFGAGVYYNGNEPYLGERPAQIDPIGGHDTIKHSGVSQGIYDEWSYKMNGVKITTHGTEAQQGLYFALKEMQKRAPEIIKEVFSKND